MIFIFDVADRQPQQLDHRPSVGKMALFLDDLPQLVVQRLDAVGGVDDDLPHGRRDSSIGTNCQASGHTRTVAGSFLPQFKPSKMSNYCAAVASVAAV
jgi:hypothetical protein